MSALASSRLASAAALLETYCQIVPQEAESFVLSWQQEYPREWVYPAVVEALYQGRYKPVSVEQLLRSWQRRGRSLTRFSGEFESLIRVWTPILSAVESPPRPSRPTEVRSPTPAPPPRPTQAPFPVSFPENWTIAQFIPDQDPSGFTQRLQMVLAAASTP